MTTFARLGLRVPVEINEKLEKIAATHYISKNTLAIQIFDSFLKNNPAWDESKQQKKLETAAQ